MIQNIGAFYKRYLKLEDKVVLGGLLLVTLLGVAMVLQNAWGAQYNPNSVDLSIGLIDFPFIVMLFIAALYIRTVAPRFGLTLWSISVMYFLYMAVCLLVYGAQLTPFPTIDAYLVRMDQSLGFDQLKWLHVTHSYHGLARLLCHFYDLLKPEVVIVPIAVGMLGLRRSVWVMYVALIGSFTVGMLVYYFFPTAAPASVFVSPDFMWAQKNTFLKFYELHHGLPNSSLTGGLVAFPSFHVVMAALFAYALKDVAYLRWLVFAVNAVMIASTVLLGWHYLMDVIGGLALAALAVIVAERLARGIFSPLRAPIYSGRL